MEGANNQSIIVIGDIHGRDQWCGIIEREKFDKIIFLGDYVSTHDKISEHQQISNLKDILSFRSKNPEKVVLLRGNHDLQHLGYKWAQCSGFCPLVHEWMVDNKEYFLKSTQWVYIDSLSKEKWIYSHAGVSQTWVDNWQVDIRQLNKQEPSCMFEFQPDSPLDYCGDSCTQSPVWIRPTALYFCSLVGYNQIIGHTPVDNISITYNARQTNKLVLCDCMPYQYLKIHSDGTKYQCETCYL